MEPSPANRADATARIVWCRGNAVRSRLVRIRKRWSSLVESTFTGKMLTRAASPLGLRHGSRLVFAQPRVRSENRCFVDRCRPAGRKRPTKLAQFPHAQRPVRRVAVRDRAILPDLRVPKVDRADVARVAAKHETALAPVFAAQINTGQTKEGAELGLAFGSYRDRRRACPQHDFARPRIKAVELRTTVQW